MGGRWSMVGGRVRSTGAGCCFASIPENLKTAPALRYTKKEIGKGLITSAFIPKQKYKTAKFIEENEK